MFGLGPGELILIFIVILLLFGAKKIPEIAQGLGKAVREFRKATRDIQEAVEKEVNEVKDLGQIKKVGEIKQIADTIKKVPKI